MTSTISSGVRPLRRPARTCRASSWSARSVGEQGDRDARAGAPVEPVVAGPDRTPRVLGDDSAGSRRPPRPSAAGRPRPVDVARRRAPRLRTCPPAYRAPAHGASSGIRRAGALTSLGPLPARQVGGGHELDSGAGASAAAIGSPWSGGVDGSSSRRSPARRRRCPAGRRAGRRPDRLATAGVALGLDRTSSPPSRRPRRGGRRRTRASATGRRRPGAIAPDPVRPAHRAARSLHALDDGRSPPMCTAPSRSTRSAWRAASASPSSRRSTTRRRRPVRGRAGRARRHARRPVRPLTASPRSRWAPAVAGQVDGDVPVAVGQPVGLWLPHRRRLDPASPSSTIAAVAAVLDDVQGRSVGVTVLPGRDLFDHGAGQVGGHAVGVDDQSVEAGGEPRPRPIRSPAATGSAAPATRRARRRRPVRARRCRPRAARVATRPGRLHRGGPRRHGGDRVVLVGHRRRPAGALGSLGHLADVALGEQHDVERRPWRPRPRPAPQRAGDGGDRRCAAVCTADARRGRARGRRRTARRPGGRARRNDVPSPAGPPSRTTQVARRAVERVERARRGRRTSGR